MITCTNIAKSFITRHGTVNAVDGVSLSIVRGEAYGLVGESGSGKTTLGKIILGVVKPDGGTVSVGTQKVQAIFQDPFNSLDPKMRIRDILAEPLMVAKKPAAGRGDPSARELDEKLVDTLDLVRLPADALAKYPHQFSGGERQRIAIARAIITRPDLIVCDEPVSSLDVTIQLQILKLLKSIREQYGITYLFISHDLRVIRFMCDRVAVMKEGRIVEEGATGDIYSHPSAPYTKLLLSSILPVTLSRS